MEQKGRKMKSGELKNGFKYEADEELLDDYEFLDLFAAAQNGEDPFAAFKAVNIMFPGEKKQQLLDFARDPKTGRASARKVMEIMGDVMEDMRKDGKNS